MNFKPLGERVLVEPIVEKLGSDLIKIPEDARREKPMKGTIVSLSDSANRDNLQVGNVVYFGATSGIKVKMEGTEYLVLRVSDLLGVEK